jgi:hypothetical protein
MLIRKLKDPLTNIDIQAVGNPDADTGQNYFTAQTWMADSRHIVVCTDIDENKMGRYVRFDTETGAIETVLIDLSWGCGIVSANDLFYYYVGSAIYEYNLHTQFCRTVCSMETGTQLYGPLSITNDGRKLGIYWKRGDDWVIGTAQVDTGSVTEVAAPGFQEPYPIANHSMINPQYDHLVFFAHEGKTEHIADRIYVADTTTHEIRNVFRQQRLDTGEHVEYVGHEMWAADGEHLYFVKYPQSPLKPTGVYRVEKWGKEQEFINGDYRYWHVATSPDGRFAVADTIEEGMQVSKIVLINLETRASKLLCELPLWREHPGHPHPMFSPNSNRVSFTFADEDQHLWLGVIDLDQISEED